MIFEVLNLDVAVVQLEIDDLLLEFFVENSFDVLLEFTRAQKVVPFGDTHNLDSVEQAAQLASIIKYFGERNNGDSIVHKSSFQIV